MATITQKLESAINSRDDIQQSINDMGVTVDNTVPLSQYSSKILQIQSGSSITPGITLWGNAFDGTTSVNGTIALQNGAVIANTSGTSPYLMLSQTPTKICLTNNKFIVDSANFLFSGFSASSLERIILPNALPIPNLSYTDKYVVLFSDFNANFNDSVENPFKLVKNVSNNINIGISDAWLNDKITNNTAISDAISAHDSNTASHNNIQSRVDSLETSVEDKSNKVAISSTATIDQYPTAKSVWDLVQDVMANIPAGGLKVPQSIEVESGLPDIATRQIGDYFYIQNMDITAEGRTGRAWVNLTDTGNPDSELRYYKVYDQYQSMDGVSITQTGGGEWEVNLTWLQNIIDTAVNNKVNVITVSNALYATNTNRYIQYSNTVDANRIVQRNTSGNIAVRGDVGLNSDLAIGAAQVVSLIPSKGTSLPLANGNATAGSSTAYAAIDHVHPASSGGNATTFGGYNSTLYVFMQDWKNTDTLSDMYLDRAMINVELSSNSTLSVSGHVVDYHPSNLFIRNMGTSQRTITIPTSGDYISMSGPSVILPGNGGVVEISISFDPMIQKYRIIALESL